MTSATLIDIADAVVNELDLAVFTQLFQVKRRFVPVYDLADLADLTDQPAGIVVSVVPRGSAFELATRTTTDDEYRIDVAIQKKIDITRLDEGDTSEIDGLMLLVAEMAGFFNRGVLGAFEDAQWLKTENQPVFSPEHLEQFHQFTSVITLTYRVG